MDICGGSAASLFNGREVHWVGALGRGGQSIRIVPELDLVVVVTAGYYQDYSPQAFQVAVRRFPRTSCGQFRLRAELQGITRTGTVRPISWI